MARAINSRLRISGKLVAETPLHVGGIGGNSDTDMALAVNGKDELYVPGTSIAGVLRAWCERNFGKDLAENIWGFQETNSQIAGMEKDKSHASFVLIEDAVVITKELVDGKLIETPILPEIRDGVGIDRFYGVAAEGAKYDREILPRGTKLNFEMIVEIADRKLNPKEERRNTSDIYDETEEQFEHRIKKNKAIFGHLLQALQNGELRFGGSRTRGLGKLRLSLTKKIKDEGFVGFDNIIAGLKRKIEEEKNETAENIDTKAEIEKLIKADETTEPNSNSRLEIKIDWSPVQPLMVKAGYEGIGVDMLPVTSGVENGNLSLVLAGSSIKGALRSQAERIVRTLKPNIATGDDFNKQIIVPIVSKLFGGKKEKDNSNQPKSKVGLGALSVDDCYSVESFDRTNWKNVEQETAEDKVSAKDWEITTALEAVHSKMTSQTKIPNPHFQLSHRTAIDRFTGGAAEGALYSVLTPHNIEWQPIKMSLDFGRTENDKCCLMLLLLVLRDLSENRLPLGFATNRGMGEVEVKRIEITGNYNIIWENEKFYFADETLKTKMTEEWEKWTS